ncbi:hypothetical protein M2169_005818 [Streptomyces sp. MJP52]|nr:hypothetical protein [Streptomyces sp. MJP52]
MKSELQLISDDDGLAVIGDPTAVERFLVSEELPSRDLGLHRLGPALRAASEAAQMASDLAADSGRWVKLTKQSAEAIEKYGLRTSSRTGYATGVLKGDKGQIKGFVEFVQGPGALLGNPALLAGAAGIMAQLARQQAMDEITDYLAAIDEKVDDVLRAQKDAALAGMIGADFVIEEAMTVREAVGRVSEVTWSKVQATSTTVATTQAYALRQLDGLAQKVEHKAKIGELAKATREIEPKVREWLAVLARCCQLHDAVAVLELDRVLDASPEELDSHRLGLRAARQKRLDHIARCTEHLLGRMNAAAGTANDKVLLHPTTSRAVVHSSNHVATSVVDFQGRLGIEGGQESLKARRWVEAAAEVRDKALAVGAEGVDVALRVGNETLGRARTVTGRLSSGIAERAQRLRGEAEARDGEGREAEAREGEPQDDEPQGGERAGGTGLPGRVREAARLWQDHRDAAFPAGLRGVELEGIDMVLLDAETAGCVRTWIDNEGVLDLKRERILQAGVEELELVIPQITDPSGRAYYERLHRLALLVSGVPGTVA